MQKETSKLERAMAFDEMSVSHIEQTFAGIAKQPPVQAQKRVDLGVGHLDGALKPPPTKKD